MNTGWPNKSGTESIGNGITLSMREAARRVLNGSNFGSKYSGGITTDVFNAGSLDDSRGGVGGSHSFLLVRMSDCMCIMSSHLAGADRTTPRTYRHSAFSVTRKRLADRSRGPDRTDYRRLSSTMVASLG